MSGEDLSVSAETLRAAASSLTGLVGSVPQHSIVDLSGCGSASVARAAADFDLWVAITGRIASERFQGLSAHATLAADAIDELDEQLAAGTGA
jgi:hypothetical protein